MEIRIFPPKGYSSCLHDPHTSPRCGPHNLPTSGTFDLSSQSKNPKIDRNPEKSILQSKRSYRSVRRR
jgi:hypothetical protein